ncbi:hypothetical protein [Calothrix sp. NIES-2100]
MGTLHFSGELAVEIQAIVGTQNLKQEVGEIRWVSEVCRIHVKIVAISYA